ncbi:hypothetical protein PILCRDRAFT_822831 [Piloderma croceum F 1598]|uniref:Uncharacterized protein n=1 Tax=Piloderma croceum (strain F 1598) TaxID=765440 RepID=A0A0C3F5K9_PILCF|nr:hypothetical protein PILCRDRAFT_822831 [Piloderma croceum F 1598]
MRLRLSQRRIPSPSPQLPNLPLPSQYPTGTSSTHPLQSLQLPLKLYNQFLKLLQLYPALLDFYLEVEVLFQGSVYLVWGELG